MRKIIFPPVESATEDGLVAIGGDLETDTLIEAYRLGIFPWPISLDFPLAWFSPNPRGIIDFSEFHLPRSFKKFLKINPFHVSFNQAFGQVIRQCAWIQRKDHSSTWITPQIIEGYEKLFNASMAYSVEVWNGEELVGGLYGVCMGDYFSGESMFSKENNASKIALMSIVHHLEKQGIKWLDTQMVTSIVKLFGGKYISRQEFLQRLKTNSDFHRTGGYFPKRES
jgi:leucyl/phenylalanyl-tRNA---protein transferase